MVPNLAVLEAVILVRRNSNPPRRVVGQERRKFHRWSFIYLAEGVVLGLQIVHRVALRPRVERIFRTRQVLHLPRPLPQPVVDLDRRKLNHN